jgi:hypothetical protein
MEVSTRQAIDLCLALGRLAGRVESSEFLDMRIDGRSIHLLPEFALKLSGALLRKADAADDWQLACGKPKRGLNHGNR